MKRLLFIIVFLLVAGFVAIKWLAPLPETSSQTDTSQNSSPTPLLQGKTVSVDGKTMGYAFVKAKPEQVSLIANFTEQKTSEQIIEEHSCRAGINGGFYDTANRPLGLFTTDDTTLRGVSESTLINGFVGVLEDNTAFISLDPPTKTERFALQTGPLLITHTTPRHLAIRDDEHARRMAVATTDDNALIFLTLYQPESVFDGPLLEDMPEMIVAISKQEKLDITHAINLDGGSASAFYGDTVTLSELTSVGSFFCVQVL